MTEPKYILQPGWIVSKVDGQEHYINQSQLAALYKVPMCECVALNSGLAADRRFLAERYRNLPTLRPRHDGDYRHPSEYAPGELR